jgi:hypothetical protein
LRQNGHFLINHPKTVCNLLTVSGFGFILASDKSSDKFRRLRDLKMAQTADYQMLSEFYRWVIRTAGVAAWKR